MSHEDKLLNKYKFTYTIYIQHKKLLKWSTMIGMSSDHDVSQEQLYQSLHVILLCNFDICLSPENNMKAM